MKNMFGHELTYVEWAALSGGTLFLLWFSWWASLRERRLHGISRFFSFEAILILVLINARAWFRNPLCLRQVASWLCLAASISLAIPAFYLLLRRGKPEGGMENTTQLVQSGIYRFIRHPMYSSLLFGGMGAFLKQVTWLSVVLALVNTLALCSTAIVEEGENRRKFGDSYTAYMKKTKRFVPFLF